MCLTRATIFLGTEGAEGAARGEAEANAAVTLLPMRAPVGNSGPIRGRTLTVFPAPAAPPDLVGVFAARVEPGGRAGFAVADLAEADALAMARTLDLSEFLFWDGRRARVVPITE